MTYFDIAPPPKTLGGAGGANHSLKQLENTCTTTPYIGVGGGGGVCTGKCTTTNKHVVNDFYQILQRNARCAVCDNRLTAGWQLSVWLGEIVTACRTCVELNRLPLAQETSR